MIKRLQHTNIDTAKTMKAVFQVSYKVEAELLGATDFPPLKRPLEGYTECSNTFYGYFIKDTLAGVIEIIHNADYTHVRSLVVDPKYFRKGIATQLMEFTLDKYDSKLFIVETGAANGPASALYLKLGFTKVCEFDTPFGIRKVKFEKRITG